MKMFWQFRLITLSILTFCISLSAHGGETETHNLKSVDEFEAYLDGLVAAQFNDYDLAGMTFSLIHNGEVRVLKGFGEIDLVKATPVDPNRHLFRPGSVSKLFTWTAVMQLVEQGKLDLNADLSTYVDQFEIPNEFQTPLTLAHVLTHTPGLEDGAIGFLFADNPQAIVPLAESLAAHIPAQVRKPGTYASYSNWATALAGLVVANVSGKTFEQYVADHIFAPLNMQQATFEEPLPEHLAGDMATGYVSEQGELTPLGFEYIKNFGPAGALSASTGDMVKFMLAHLNQGQLNGAQILSPETTALMHSNLFAHADNVAASAHGFYETWRYGQRFIGHAGDTIAFHSELLLDPTRGFGLFVSFNSPDGALARSAIVNGVVDFFYPTQPKRWSVEPLEGTEARAAEVAGTYRLNRRSYTKLEGVSGLVSDFAITPLEGGAINIEVPDLGGTFREVEPYVYQKMGKETRLVFQKDPGEQVSRMLISNMPVMVADRVAAYEAGPNHLLVIGLASLASLFVLINFVRNRKLELSGSAKTARRLVALTSGTNIVFLLVWGGVLSGIDMNRIIFDFPPPGTGFALVFPILIALLTFLCALYVIPVWRSPECGMWARVRYTYVTLVFVMYVAILNYWNMIGWKY